MMGQALSLKGSLSSGSRRNISCPMVYPLNWEKDLLEHEIVRERILAFDYTENFSLYLSYICKAITSKTGTSSIFPELVPKVRTYIENYLFDQMVDGENPDVTKKLNYIPIREKSVVFSQRRSVLSPKRRRRSGFLNTLR